MRLLYRVRQFWRTIFLKTDFEALEQARSQLSPDLWALFTQMQPAEQAHATRIYRKLLDQGEDQPDLLAAALMHDVGKLRYRLNPIERAVVVLVKAIKPELARRWGSEPQAAWHGLPGWRKAFIVAGQHASWGAEMSHQAGISPLAEALIRQHDQPHGNPAGNSENILLHKLWLVDNDS